MESFRTSGTCARQILFEVKDDLVAEVKFVGGCSGNLQAIARFSEGRPIDEVIRVCSGISCRNNTSCPDQLAKALLDYQSRQK